MRLAVTLCFVSALVVLSGCCGAGGCGVAKAPSMRSPAAYGSASGSARTAYAHSTYQRAPRVVVREVARPAAPSYERRLSTFTPPSAPVIPAARRAAPARTAVACPPAPCPPAACPPAACAPAADPCDPCAGGNCGIPSVDDCCPGGNCGIPSLDDLLNPCK